MAKTATKPFISTFTPSLTDPEILEKIFVQRHDLVKDTVARIKDSATTDEKHHHLFVGPRGSGKTHLVSIINHRLTKDKSLNDKLRIAWLNEDESAASYPLLLTRIYKALANRYKDEFSEKRLADARKNADGNHKEVFEKLIIDDLKDHVLLIIIENLDDVFHGIGKDAQWNFRSFIQNTGKVSLLVTSPQLTKDIKKREAAFFGFFHSSNLNPLSVDEAKELLIHIAEIKNDKKLVDFLNTDEGLSRIKALHQVAGGSQRVFVIMGELINKKSFDNLVQPFLEMLDELTPYYQERIKHLPPRQRSIVELLTQSEHTRSVTQISDELLITNATVASELRKLRDKRFVEHQKQGKETYYWLAEPLMRMSVQVKDNSTNNIPIIIQFLVIWYDQESLLEGLKSCSVDIRNKDHIRIAFAKKVNAKIEELYNQNKINKFTRFNFYHTLYCFLISALNDNPSENLSSMFKYDTEWLDYINHLNSICYRYLFTKDKRLLLELEPSLREIPKKYFESTDSEESVLDFYKKYFQKFFGEIDFTKE